MLFKILIITFIVCIIEGVVVKKDKGANTVSLVNVREQIKKNSNIIPEKATPQKEKNPQFWKNLAQKELQESLKKQRLNKNKAKNIILFLGDGMSLSTIAAARMLKGQRNGQTGEEESLSFENFPYTGLSKTYCANAQVADSACSATAYLCGVKANILTVGVNANVRFNNCSESMNPQNHVSSIVDWAQKAGKSTGFITTSPVTDASPSASYAHAASRFFESDTDIRKFREDPTKCMDIATQLITQEPGRNFDVIMGGGMSKFLPNTTVDDHGNFGIREDGKDLLSTWKSMHPRSAFVSNRKDLLDLDTSKVSKIMGIFQSEYMGFHLKADVHKQPTLSEMTEVALKLLQRNDNGYFIFIEGDLIDIAHHETKAELALDETVEFEKAVKLARDMTDPKETLIVVTSDHAHPLTIVGYPIRGDDILGVNQHTFDANGQKYTTLNYAMGPKQYLDEKGNRLNLEDIKKDADFQYPGLIPSNKGHHSGDDVGIYASGPFDHLFTGVIEESTIPHLMAYAACIGDGQTMCNGDDGDYDDVDEKNARRKAFFDIW